MLSQPGFAPSTSTARRSQKGTARPRRKYESTVQCPNWLGSGDCGERHGGRVKSGHKFASFRCRRNFKRPLTELLQVEDSLCLAWGNPSRGNPSIWTGAMHSGKRLPFSAAFRLRSLNSRRLLEPFFRLLPGNAQNTLARPAVWLTIALTTVVCIVPVVAFRFLKLDLRPELADTVGEGRRPGARPFPCGKILWADGGCRPVLAWGGAFFPAPL